MRSPRPNELGKSIERFFREYLPTLRGTSRHTIRNYRDAIVLFLRFTSSQRAKAIEALDLAGFTAQQVRDFLARQTAREFAAQAPAPSSSTRPQPGS